MLLDNWYIIRDQNLFPTGSNRDDSGFIIQIDASSLTQTYSDIVSLNAPPKWGILIDEYAESQVEDLIPFFLIDSYCVNNGRPVLFTAKLTGSAINLLNQKLKLQGFEDLNIVDTSSIHVLYPSNENNFKSAYRAACSEIKSEVIFIQIFAQEDLLKSLELMELIEKEVKELKPDLFELKQKQRELRALQVKSDIGLITAQNEISTLTSHIGILKSGSQAKQIQDFYNQEYEILPAWYKKFGHIIKVLTGKRRYKSLLNDQEKKYND